MAIKVTMVTRQFGGQGDIIVVAEASGLGAKEKMDEYREWLEFSIPGAVAYKEFFTGRKDMSSTDCSDWKIINDPDHDKRVLIKLRWQ